LAGIFVSYTSSDRAGGHPWIWSGGTHGVQRTSAFMGPSRHQSDTPTSQDAICAEATSRIDVKRT
jgi:hypothetical protein